MMNMTDEAIHNMLRIVGAKSPVEIQQIDMGIQERSKASGMSYEETVDAMFKAHENAPPAWEITDPSIRKFIGPVEDEEVQVQSAKPEDDIRMKQHPVAKTQAEVNRILGF
jgi:hypothetical protein